MIEEGERERDMGPDEAFERLLGVDPDNLDDNMKWKKKPPPKRWPGAKGKSKPTRGGTAMSIRRSTRKQYRAEAKIRIVLEGLPGKDSIAELRHVIGKSTYR